MSVFKTLYHYKSLRGNDSECGVVVRKEQEDITVILVELESNLGTSVTNKYETIATQVYHKYLQGAPIENITWVDNYRNESFNKVTMDWSEEKFSNPRWERMEYAEGEKLMSGYGEVKELSWFEAKTLLKNLIREEGLIISDKKSGCSFVGSGVYSGNSYIRIDLAPGRC